MRVGRVLLALALASAAGAGPSLAAGSGSCPPGPFLQQTHLPLPIRPTGVASADLNHDDHSDLVVTGDGEIDVLLGDGSGGFGSPVKIADFPGEVVTIGDFNGDGDPDIAAAGIGQVTVLLNDGDAHFTTSYAQGVTGGTIPFLLTANVGAGDALDLLLTDGSNIVVLLGNGDGTFQAPISTSGGGGVNAAVADFDEDGNPDVISVAGFAPITFLRGNGDGTFAAPVSIPVGGYLSSIASANIDGDGHADIVVAIVEPGGVGYAGVLLGDGHGNFQAAVENFLGRDPTALILRDLDGDGYLDVVTLLAGGGFGLKTVGVTRGNGTAVLEPAAQYLAGDTPSALDAADFDGDGQLDVVTANSQVFDASLLFGNGGARLRSVAAVETVGNFFVALPGDFDGDGLIDAITQDSDDALDSLLPGNGDGTFRAAEALPFSGDLEVAGRFHGGTGPLDVVAGGFVRLNDGHGHFQTGQELPDSFPTQTADLRGNGRTDLVGPALSPTQFAALLGNGDGTFQPAVFTGLPNFENSIATGRIDGDTLDDVVVGTSSSPFGINTVSAFLSNGDGTFNPSYAFDIGAGPLKLLIADVTLDGKPDLLAANGPNGTLLFVGHGDGTFDDPVVFDSALASSTFVADFDQDGVPDVLTTNYSPQRARFFRGLGGGAYAPPVDLETASFAGIAALPATGSAADVVMTGGPAPLSLLVNAHLAPSVAPQSVIVGSAAKLSAAASGFGLLTYQWRKNLSPLSDGGPVSGAHTAILTIDPAAFTDGGTYDVLVTDSCGSVASNGASLSVEFDDVPLTNPFHDDILTIATIGITAGCTTTSYCPSQDVSRAEMAVFLLKSKDGAGHVPPPPPPDPIFPDVPADAFAAAWIDELATLGVTGGCGGGLYCPDRSVTRAEMAVFLLKTLLGSGYTPPPPAGIFADVPEDNFAIAWIEDLYNRGVTAGCATNPLRFCPDANVPREQMATFLVRTFSIP